MEAEAKLADCMLALKSAGKTTDYYDVIRGQIYELEYFIAIPERELGILEGKSMD